jgi:hypothetical protein
LLSTRRQTWAAQSQRDQTILLHISAPPHVAALKLSIRQLTFVKQVYGMGLHWVLQNILTWASHIKVQRVSMSVRAFFCSDWPKPWIICQDCWCPHWDSNQHLLSPSPNPSVTYYPHNSLYPKSHPFKRIYPVLACDYIFTLFLIYLSKFTAMRNIS